MRPGQQKQRGRSRNSSGGNPNNSSSSNQQQRKGQNPLTRSYDSSGPDVKIRGTAQHIAEKYLTLARDAQSSGDRVMAENYLQHAEHYNRIIAAAQAMFQERYQRDDRAADAGDRDDDEVENGQGQQPQPQQQHHQQPHHQQHRQQPQPQPRPEVEAEAPQPVVTAPVVPTIDENTPQPVFDETPAEVQIEQEVVAATDGKERAPSRRRSSGGSSRPRRQPRQPREAGAEASAEAPAPAEEPAE